MPRTAHRFSPRGTGALFAEQVSKPENTPHIGQLFVNAVTGGPDTLHCGMYHFSTPGPWQSPEYRNGAGVDRYLEAGRSVASEEDREAPRSKLNARLMEIAPTIHVYDRQSVSTARNQGTAPALTDPAQAIGLDGMGFTFRLMDEVDD